VVLAWVAASVRADAGECRRLSIRGLPPDAADVVTLLFEILGWQVVTAGTEKAAFGTRFAMTPGEMPGDGVVHVTTDDPALTQRLAATGLDRLVLPFSLAALEQLSVVAG
jgi:hypothetical protein